MKILRLGSIGPSVQLLQLALERAGFGPVTTDGIFGTATQYALRRFQQANAIPVDGVAGSVTHRALLPWYTGFLIHTAARGDTLYSIAQRHGSTTAALTLANPDIDAASLMPDTPVVVPLPFDVVPTGIDYCRPHRLLCARACRALSLHRHGGDRQKRDGPPAVVHEPRPRQQPRAVQRLSSRQ